MNKLKNIFWICALVFCSFAVSSLNLAHAVDLSGADLTPSDYETISGTYTNVGNFIIGAGDTVFIAPGEGLFIYASSVTITGHLNANGRGNPGGSGGENGLIGGNGFGLGGGFGGSAGDGGGGAGYGDSDEDGQSGGDGNVDGSGGSGGGEYNSTTTITIPFSADDIYLGSGGGGGGGGNSYTTSGSGGSGGGLIYLQANYIAIVGSITVNGSNGGSGLNSDDCAGNPGGGGGGSGGSIIIKSLENFVMTNSYLSSVGGIGGATMCNGGTTTNPGGGGAGGRIKLIYNSHSFSNVIISTGIGIGGEDLIFALYAKDGSSGTVSYGIMASSPTGFNFGSIFITSATYAWSDKLVGEWGEVLNYLPSLTTYQFRVFTDTSAIPFTDYFTGVSVASDTLTVTESALIPNTTVQRFLTAYTDFGDSLPSASISTYTYAAVPDTLSQNPFSSVSENSLIFTWSSGTAAVGYNPSYTDYEISRSSHSDFSLNVSTNFTVGLSSSVSTLSPNTTYYFRVRAKGLNNVYTDFPQIVSTATFASAPSASAFENVYISSLVFVWNEGTNPAGTFFEVYLSTDNFLSITTQTLTSQTTAIFENLDAGYAYYAKARALNHGGVQSNYSVTVSTIVGNMSNLDTPSKPNPPAPRNSYSYDGAAEFIWYPPSGSVPIYRYWLEIGISPGANDFLAVFETTALSYSTNTLVSGKNYYARVMAESEAGILSEFSDSGPGVSVWVKQTEAAINKAYNWPNPFSPIEEVTNIGFNLKEAARVEFKIYTLSGHQVYEKSQSESSSGNKVWTWNGRNGAGRMVEPGGYIALIMKHYQSGVETQKFKIAVLY